MSGGGDGLDGGGRGVGRRARGRRMMEGCDADEDAEDALRRFGCLVLVLSQRLHNIHNYASPDPGQYSPPEDHVEFSM